MQRQFEEPEASTQGPRWEVWDAQLEVWFPLPSSVVAKAFHLNRIVAAIER